MLIYVTQTGKINCTKGGAVCVCVCEGAWPSMIGVDTVAVTGLAPDLAKTRASCLPRNEKLLQRVFQGTLHL